MILKISIPSWEYNKLLYNFVYVSVTCTVFDSPIAVNFQTSVKFWFRFSCRWKLIYKTFDFPLVTLLYWSNYHTLFVPWTDTITTFCEKKKRLYLCIRLKQVPWVQMMETQQTVLKEWWTNCYHTGGILLGG